jgi:hypothetical protein
MAVGTVLGASYWSAWSAREGDIEQEKLLKVLISNGMSNYAYMVLT